MMCIYLLYLLSILYVVLYTILYSKCIYTELTSIVIIILLLLYTPQAFTSALTAQYIEYFYYRGIGHPERAGNCKTGHDPNPRPILSFLKYYLNFLRGRAHAKIQNHETESENENEESVTEEKEDQEDDNKSEDGNIEQNKIPLKSVLKKPKPIHNIHENDNKTQENEGTNIEGLKPKPVENNGNKSKRRPSSATAASESSRRKSSDIIGYADNGDPIFRPVIEYTDWKCIVCNKDNHQPTHSKVDSDIWFGEKGVHYKRTYAVIQARRDVPTCVKCGTYADYKPPLGSAHIFPYNPTPHKAFEGYPVPSTVQAGLKPDIYSRFLYALKGFFFGIKDNINSAPLKNDWRLEKFVNNRFPELPRYVLKPGECYQVGEIVECKQQKFAWARARVLVAHNNHSYDIRYDPGDELRFVEERAIRTIPEKRAYAFRVEMGLVVIALLSPLGLALGLVSGNIGLSMLGLLVVSTALLSIRLVMIAQYFINYFDAGLVPVLKLSAIYTLPLLFLMIASAIGVGSGASPSAWSGVAVLLILTKVSTLPYLYIYRPPYLVIGGSVFLLSSIGIVGMSMYASSPASVVYITLPIAPILIMTIWIKIIRTNLHNIWDVCLIIRPAKNTEFENPSVLGKAKDLIMEYIDP